MFGSRLRNSVLARDNRSLGKFHLDGIPPAPRGVPQVEVSFDIDANGILHVSAKDRATSKEQSIRIEASSGLSETEIKEMVKDAESHADEDRKRKEAVEVRNRADSLVYEAEKQLKENGDKFDATLKSDIESKAEAVKDAMKGEDVTAIGSATEALQQALHAAAAKLYQQAGPAPGAGEQAPPQGEPKKKGEGGDGAVDADYEVVN